MPMNPVIPASRLLTEISSFNGRGGLSFDVDTDSEGRNLMSRLYDIFELLPDGSKLLRGCAAGLDGAS
jgi:hypothetical protein